MTATNQVLDLIKKGTKLQHPNFSDWALDIEEVLFERDDELEKENAELNEYLQTDFVHFADTYFNKSNEQFRNEIMSKLEKIKELNKWLNPKLITFTRKSGDDHVVNSTKITGYSNHFIDRVFGVSVERK